MLSVRLRHTAGAFTLDAAFEAPLRGVTVLFGPSGAGKSTILHAIAGLLQPQMGRVAVDGTVLLDTETGQAIPAHRRRLGVVFQDARLLPHLTVQTNLRYGARRAPPGAEGPGFDDVVDLLAIRPLLTRRPRHLSGGERQRVALGRALLSRPLMLLMDEPLAALGLPRRAEILPFLERLRHLPILYVTHALEEVDRLADTLVLLDGGRVVAAGAVGALTARTDLPLLSGRADAGAVLAGTVLGHDPARGLTQMGFAGGALLIPLRPEPPGTALRLRVRARDVSVATVRPVGLSSHNILEAEIAAIEPTGPHAVLLRLTIGPTALLAALTRDAVAQLGLVPGRAVFALVKSAAFGQGEA